MWKEHYDVLIVGAGVAGSALAHALSTLSATRARPLKIALLERSLAEPDRIVGELLQPGGVNALKELGMEDCLEGIDAVPVKGYCVVRAGGDETVHIPYPAGHEGRSFHHGRFIQNLRAKARAAPRVTVLEATVNELIECDLTHRVLGVEATPKETGVKESFFADLVVVADGCFSKFRTQVLSGSATPKPATRSHFLGAVLTDAPLPLAQHGTVCLVKDSGPVLLYQIGTHDTRMLVDLKEPLPADPKAHVLAHIVPQLPPSLHVPVEKALEADRLRRMPNSFLPGAEQGTSHQKEGAVLLGDAWNMRHPLTGGGMTVAFNDVVMLSRLLVSLDDLHDWSRVSRALHTWHWRRKRLAATVNILSVALYDLFGAEDEHLEVLRTGCFKYFELGGDCVAGPVGLLSAITPSPFLLFRHFFAVAFYSIWVMFTHPRPVPVPGQLKPVMAKPGIDEYPALLLKSVRVFWTACVVFGPLMWIELF
ncbi:squalene epoxidase-like protein [Punctularia strigosozonata HHB-11173 SS5]|uniref:squalene epoxidase-like protein n=1 Tax=Punctularia strigosozonata (strain HHB-11173) TaxID=741275 RepID=UPI0004417F82|nr:squalene epoxidase-like protein [Punctularia strigosozonata HHB-11173 SS5]EIN06316.1 squalene epoxidase-like protein [Punctularia strigosozonata HHB-11173 SS5]